MVILQGNSFDMPSMVKSKWRSNACTAICTLVQSSGDLSLIGDPTSQAARNAHGYPHAPLFCRLHLRGTSALLHRSRLPNPDVCEQLARMRVFQDRVCDRAVYPKSSGCSLGEMVNHHRCSRRDRNSTLFHQE